MVASFHCWGTSPVLHTLTCKLGKYRSNSRWSIFSNSAGRESGPTVSQFGIPRITAVMSSMGGSSPSDGANGRCGNRALMVGSSLDDFVIRRVPKHLSHRSRMRTFTLRSVPSSPRMNCSRLAFRPSNPAVPFKCLYKSRWSLSARSLSVSARYASK